MLKCKLMFKQSGPAGGKGVVQGECRQLPAARINQVVATRLPPGAVPSTASDSNRREAVH